MKHRPLLLLVVLTLISSFVLESAALAQRGGRSSSRSATSRTSSSRSSVSSSSRSSRSSASSSLGRTSSRSSSRSSTRSIPSITSPTRSTSTPTLGSTSRSSTTSSRSYGRTSTTSAPSTTRGYDLGSSSTRPTTTSRTDSARTLERLTGRGSSSTTPPAPRVDPSGTNSIHDISRRVSSFDRRSNSASGFVDLGSSSSRATTGRRTSTVPTPYTPTRPARTVSQPGEVRREALSSRLRDAAAVRVSPEAGSRSLSERYTPSARRGTLSAGGVARRAPSAEAAAAASRPGESRRRALGLDASGASSERIAGARSAQKERRIDSARSQHRATRTRNARQQRTEADREALETRVRNARKQYQAAVGATPGLEEKLEAASTAIAVAGDVAIRTALAASPVGAGAFGSCGTNGAWSGYDNGAWCDWYWNSYYPSWCNWWWGSYGFGWSWCWGFGWSSSCWSWNWCASPSWAYPCYWSSYAYAWPTYCWWTPAVIYEVVERPVSPAQPAVAAPQATPAPTAVPAMPDLSLRAATEYMALGDRAFTEGRYGDAVHYYARAVEFAPEDGVLQLVLSDALFATGDYHYAAFALRRALELNPELASLGLDKRTFYGLPEDFDRQLAVLQRFVTDHPIDEDARLVLAANLVFSLRLEEALAVLDAPYSEGLRRTGEGQLLRAAAAGLLASR